MKLVYICAAVVVLALSAQAMPEMPEEIKVISKACQDEVHSTREELEKFFKGGMNPADASDAVKCHIKCMMEKQGHLKDGVFDEKEFLEHIKTIPHLKDHAAELTAAAGECKAQKGDNDCDTALKIMMCFKSHKTSLGMEQA